MLDEKYVINFVVDLKNPELYLLMQYFRLAWQQSIKEKGRDHYIEFYPLQLHPYSNKLRAVTIAIFYIKE